MSEKISVACQNGLPSNVTESRPEPSPLLDKARKEEQGETEGNFAK
jgi:hypothetical protein